MINFNINKSLRHRFNFKCHDEAYKLLSSKNVADIINELASDLAEQRRKLAKCEYDVKSIDAGLWAKFHKARFNMMPEGKPDDWYGNKSYTDRSADKTVSTHDTYECLKELSKFTRKRNGQLAKTAYDNILRQLCEVEKIIDLLSIIYPVYTANVTPRPIEHNSYNPNADIRTQILPGYLWKRLAARSITPSNLNAFSVFETKPTWVYSMAKNSDGSYRLKTTGKALPTTR